MDLEPPVRGPFGAVGLDGMGTVTTAQGIRAGRKCPQEMRQAVYVGRKVGWHPGKPRPSEDGAFCVGGNTLTSILSRRGRGGKNRRRAMGEMQASRNGAVQTERKRVFSGIQPSGELHLGNYLGAMKGWAERQHEKENFFCIVDLHAITVPQDPDMLRRRTRSVAAMLLATG